MCMEFIIVHWPLSRPLDQGRSSWHIDPKKSPLAFVLCNKKQKNFEGPRHDFAESCGKIDVIKLCGTCMSVYRALCIL
jgi:hypothetical protein